MVFATALKQPAMFLMLNEQDIIEMRQGRTKFVDARMSKGKEFTSAIISLHPTDQAAVDLIKQYGGAGVDMSDWKPNEEEEVCSGCRGTLRKGSLFEGKCTVCWATEAKLLRAMGN